MKESQNPTLREIWPIVALIAVLWLMQIGYLIFDVEVNKTSFKSYISILSHGVILLVVMLMPAYAKWRVSRRSN